MPVHSVSITHTCTLCKYHTCLYTLLVAHISVHYQYHTYLYTQYHTYLYTLSITLTLCKNPAVHYVSITHVHPASIKPIQDVSTTLVHYVTFSKYSTCTHSMDHTCMLCRIILVHFASSTPIYAL